MKKLREQLFLLLPIAFFLSYLPHVYLGFTKGTNLDISVLHIVVGVFIATSLPAIWRQRQQLARHRIVQFGLLFVVLAAVSLLWTPNILRGGLAVGLILLIYFALLSLLTFPNLKQLLPKFFTILLIGATGASVFAWYQVIGEVLGWVTFLPENYKAGLFGFARPTAFAQEPQFFASQLLAPILALSYLFIHRKADKRLVILLFFLVVTLVATLSRGAIFALIIGVTVLLVTNFVQRKRFIPMLLLYVGAGFVSLTMLGLAAQTNSQVNGTYYTAITKAVNQLSMGVIELPEVQQEAAPTNTGKRSAESKGYVEASTNERMSMNRLAIRTITESPITFFAGVGVGGTGFAYAERSGCPQSCINFVEYLDIWVELGIVGLLLFIALLARLIRIRIVAALVAAYAAQWFFFAGFPNSLPVFLSLMLLIAWQLPLKRSKKEV